MNARLIVLLGAVSTLCLSVTAFAQDRVVMKNGDVITGNISLVTDEDVFIEPSYADEFSVNLSEVASIEIEDTFDVELADRSKMSGQITLNDAGEQVLIVDGQETALDLTQIAEAAEPASEAGRGHRYSFHSRVPSLKKPAAMHRPRTTRLGVGSRRLIKI